MLYELAKNGNFFLTWAVMTVLAFVMAMAMSAVVFYFYYAKPTYSRWQYKLNPTYPTPSLVRREVLQMLKGIVTASFCPALSLHLVDRGWSKAYGGLGGYGVGYLVFTFFVAWITSDFFEFFYHRLGHTTRWGWKEHKAHHVFANPSPFAVIADDLIDQLVRSAPLLLIPLVMPINMDLLFLTFAVFFYGYGAFLHWGHELSFLSAHNRWINGSFQHYLHHAKSTLLKPIHTGFFFKLWDQMFGSTYPDEGNPEKCLCSACCRSRGERSEEAWAKVEHPDYSVLLSPSFWAKGADRKEKASASAVSS
ncbi:MAG: sterol desaturase family protein [Polyangiaceae bacterium]